MKTNDNINRRQQCIPPLKHVILAMIHCAFCGHENKNKLGRAFGGLA